MKKTPKITLAVCLLALLYALAGCAAQSPKETKTSPAPARQDSPQNTSENTDQEPASPSLDEEANAAKPAYDDRIAGVSPAEAELEEEVESLFEGDTFEESPREQVEDLAEEIEELANTLGLNQENAEEAVSAPSDNASTQCADLCEASKGICTSSKKICRISSEHPNDPYFIDRCQWSGKLCTQSQTRCDECS